MTKRITLLVVGILLLLATPALSAQGGGFLLDSEPSAPEAADPFVFHAGADPPVLGPGTEGAIVVAVRIPPGHKLYASKMSIVPGDAPGVGYGALIAPESIEQKEPDGTVARFHVGEISFRLPVSIDPEAAAGPVVLPLTVRYQGCSETGCFFPREKRLEATLTIDAAAGGGAPAVSRGPSGEGPPAISGENPYEKTARRFGIAGVLAAAFAWGLLASLTPCVYPMIPITMSVIGAVSTGSLSRGFLLSMIYVLGMSWVYAAFGVAAAWSGGLFGGLSDHPAVRIGVAAVFGMLALSLFDLFHIRMPSRLASRLGGKFGGGAIGVFFTGAAAGAVVGPCVGPLLVALLVYIATLGDRLQGFLIMWSFALGMGTLFVVIGTFSGAVSRLPKSGPWMERLKHAFGVFMLGAALYYLAPLLPERIVLLAVGAFLIGTGTFLGGVDALPPEAGGYARFKKTLGILCLTLGVVYAARFALTGGVVSSAPQPAGSPGIAWYTDAGEALKAASRTRRPVMIDFSADWCAACRDLDEKTFADPEVVAAAGGFVSLRVDNSDAREPAAASLRKKYGVVGLPTIVFTDAQGRAIPGETVTAFIPPAELSARMERVAAARVD